MLEVEGVPVGPATAQPIRTWRDAIAQFGSVRAVYLAVLADDPAIDPDWAWDAINHDALSRFALAEVVRELLRAVRRESNG
jgi:hypothetical protein